MAKLLDDHSQLLARIAALEEENKRLAATKAATISYKVQTEKRNSDGKVTGPGSGAVSVYGLNKQFPVTLYAAQWKRLIANIKAGHLDAFLDRPETGALIAKFDKRSEV
jgi:hypothetical protein